MSRRLIFTNQANQYDSGNYTYGAGVGARSRFVRSVLKRKATKTQAPPIYDLLHYLVKKGFSIIPQESNAGLERVSISDDGGRVAILLIDTNSALIFDYRTPTASEWTTVLIAKGDDVNNMYGEAEAFNKKYWVQVGNVIQGDPSIYLGLQGMELSGDGNNIIFASPSEESSGQIECYELNGGTWSNMDTQIEGVDNNTYIFHISGANNQDRIVVGRPTENYNIANVPAGENSDDYGENGAVFAYELRHVTQSEWEAPSGNRVQKGNSSSDSWTAVMDSSDSTRSDKKWFILDFSKPIIPKATSSTMLTFGYSVSITEDGYFIAVGSLTCTRDSSDDTKLVTSNDEGVVQLYRSPNHPDSSSSDACELLRTFTIGDLLGQTGASSIPSSQLGINSGISPDGKSLALVCSNIIMTSGGGSGMFSPAGNVFLVNINSTSTSSISFEVARVTAGTVQGNEGDRFGFPGCLSFSKNNLLVISSYVLSNGYVKLYHKEGNSWSMKKQLVLGERIMASTISKDGSAVIIGDDTTEYISDSNNYTDAGSGRVYLIESEVKERV